MITPLEIEKKVFSTSIKGYKKEEVDVFLDEIMIDYQKLMEENRKLAYQLDVIKKEIEENKESGSSVMETLEQAKVLMSDISASAEKRAEVIIKTAQADAEKITRDARESVANLTTESEHLAGRLNNFKARYKAMLTEEMRKIDMLSYDDFFEEMKEDFYPASMTGAADAVQKSGTRVVAGEAEDEDLLREFGIEISDRKDPTRTIVVNDDENLLDRGTRAIR